MSDNISLVPYGSYCTRLLTPFSDVDLSIKNNTEISDQQKKKMLGLLSENLKICSFVTQN